MAFKTLQQTTPQADVQAGDQFAIVRGSGTLSNSPISALVTFLKTGVGGIGSFFLQAANNLSDLASASTARTNLGLGTAATHAATDFVTTGGANVFTATQSFQGSSSALAEIVTNAAEQATVSATAATGTINLYAASQSVLYYTSNAAANWTVNLSLSAGTALNSVLAIGQSVTVSFLVTQGATPYYNTTVQVDGTTTGVTTKWQSAVPSAGHASAIDIYTYCIIKTANATFTVLASQVPFK